MTLLFLILIYILSAFLCALTAKKFNKIVTHNHQKVDEVMVLIPGVNMVITVVMWIWLLAVACRFTELPAIIKKFISE